MSTQEVPIRTFLRELMRRRKRLSSQLAADLGVSHATVSGWLSDQDIPNIRFCQHLAEYTGVALEKVLAIAGHLSGKVGDVFSEWPEFREYAHHKHLSGLDEDLTSMIEDLGVYGEEGKWRECEGWEEFSDEKLSCLTESGCRVGWGAAGDL